VSDICWLHQEVLWQPKFASNPWKPQQWERVDVVQLNLTCLHHKEGSESIKHWWGEQRQSRSWIWHIARKIRPVSLPRWQAGCRCDSDWQNCMEKLQEYLSALTGRGFSVELKGK